LQTSFIHKNISEDLTYVMIIKRVDTSFGGGQRGQKPQILGYFEVQATSASQHPPTPRNLQKRCVWVSYNILPNFKPKY